MRDHNRARGSACALRGRQPWQGRQRFVEVDSKAACRMACRRALMYHRGVELLAGVGTQSVAAKPVPVRFGSIDDGRRLRLHR